MNAKRQVEKGQDILLTADEVATILKVTPEWVRSHATRSNPIIPSVKLGKGKSAPRRFKLSVINEFLENWERKS